MAASTSKTQTMSATALHHYRGLNSAVLFLGIGGTLLAAAGMVWFSGHLCLLATGDGWAEAPFAQSPKFVTGVLSGEDVERAWTKAYPASPAINASLYWAIAVVMVTVLGAALAATADLWHRGLSRGTPARWATRCHERKLTVPADPSQRRWRLVAGRSRRSRHLLAGDDCVSAVVFGPNGSGKTTSLIVPNVLDWDGPVVLTTAKPQDLEPVITARRERGPVWVIAPGGAPDHTTTGWCPVGASGTDEDADRVAEWLVEASGMTDDPRARPWNAQARKYLKGLLLAAHLTGATVPIQQWCEWIHAGERARDTVEDILRSAGHAEAAQEYAATFAIHEDGKGSVLFTAMGLADTYSRPGIRQATQTAGGPDGFTADKLLDHAGTLCIVTPSGQGDRFAPYFTAILTSVIHEAESRAADAGGPITPRLLLALDEAGNVFRYPRLPHLLTTSRGNGIQLLLVYHNLAQVEHLYGGREVARTVVSNAKMRLLLPGVGDLDTLRYWSELLGRTRTQTHSETRGADGHRSRSRNDHTDDLAPLHVLQQLPDGEAVLVYHNLPPTRIRLQPWYRTRRYRHLRTTAPSPGGTP